MAKKLSAAQKFAAEQKTLRKSHANLLAAGREALSALDTLMGDSDLPEDDSPEFLACQKLAKAIDFAETKVR